MSNQLPLGAHLVSPRWGYTHHGIYTGGGRVIHYAGLSEGWRTRTGGGGTARAFQLRPAGRGGGRCRRLFSGTRACRSCPASPRRGPLLAVDQQLRTFLRLVPARHESQRPGGGTAGAAVVHGPGAWSSGLPSTRPSGRRRRARRTSIVISSAAAAEPDISGDATSICARPSTVSTLHLLGVVDQRDHVRRLHVLDVLEPHVQLLPAAAKADLGKDAIGDGHERQGTQGAKELFEQAPALGRRSGLVDLGHQLRDGGVGRFADGFDRHARSGVLR